MQSEKIRVVDTSVKPEGGFVQVGAFGLSFITWANREGLLTTRGLRVALGLFEMSARRIAYVLDERKKGRVATFTPHFSAKELGRLCGLPTKRVNAALRELFDLGFLVEFSPTVLRFASSPDALKLTEEQRSGFESWLAALTPRKRIPIPRRVLVLACESSSRAQVVFILAACLRCCWRLPDGFRYSGRLSCPWVAKTFGICLTAVKRAKTLLVTIGWLNPKGNVHRTLGELVALNPVWHRLATLPEIQKTKPQDRTAGQGGATSASVESAGTKSAPEVGEDGPKCDLPVLRETPSEKFKYQDRRETPAERPEPSGLGISNSDSQKRFKNQDPERLTAPRLSAIGPADFQDVGRALELFRQAVKCGLMPNASEHSKLLWLAAIERSRTVGARNPAGVLLYLVKNRRWDYLSEGQFEAANRRLKAFLYERPPGVPPLLVPRPYEIPSPVASAATPDNRPRLSKDGQLVKTLREELTKRGQSVSVFAALHSHGGWSRERYAAALAELATPQPCQNAV